MHDTNCFITLTYNNTYVPKDGSLKPRDFTLFMKRLRERLDTDGIKIRYFQCGEYGTLHNRPHFHALLFGYDFPDKQYFGKSGTYPIYISDLLSRLWPYGISSIADCNFDTAAYVARYCLKKITGKDAEDHYQGRIPEYTNMSRRPGIARDWFLKFKSDVYPEDTIVLKGHKMRPPKYYDNLFDKMYPGELEKLKQNRIEKMKEHPEEYTDRRLEVKEKIQKLKIKNLTRPLD